MREKSVRLGHGRGQGPHGPSGPPRAAFSRATSRAERTSRAFACGHRKAFPIGGHGRGPRLHRRSAGGWKRARFPRGLGRGGSDCQSTQPTHRPERAACELERGRAASMCRAASAPYFYWSHVLRAQRMARGPTHEEATLAGRIRMAGTNPTMRRVRARYAAAVRWQRLTPEARRRAMLCMNAERVKLIAAPVTEAWRVKDGTGSVRRCERCRKPDASAYLTDPLRRYAAWTWRCLEHVSEAVR